jgi:hypothetical protein
MKSNVPFLWRFLLDPDCGVSNMEHYFLTPRSHILNIIRFGLVYTIISFVRSLGPNIAPKRRRINEGPAWKANKSSIIRIGGCNDKTIPI